MHSAPATGFGAELHTAGRFTEEVLMSTRYLVTGGAGFIGSHVVDALLARGDAVVVLDNFNDYYAPTLKRANTSRHLLQRRYRLVEGDIRDRVLVPKLMREYAPQATIHLAAYAGVRPSLEDPYKYQSVNVEGTLNLLDAARKHGVRMFVNASSSSVYGENTTAPFEESHSLLTPASAYAATKIGAEGLTRVFARQYGMRAISLRFFTVYGPRQRPDMAIGKFATRMLQGLPVTLYGDGRARRDFTFVADVVDGILAACDYRTSQYEAINLGSGTTVTVNGLVSLLEETLGVEAKRVYTEAQAGDVPLTYSCIKKARKLLSYHPRVQLDQGLRHVAHSLRKQLGLNLARKRAACSRILASAPEEIPWGQSTTA
jgi:UDP-glucuronate 4-epimerase